MSLLLDVLTAVAIACGAVGAGLALFMLVSRRPNGQHASRVPASSEWRTVRACCGVILLSVTHWTGGVLVWLLLAVGLWLLLVWDLTSWLRTRYRLTRVG